MQSTANRIGYQRPLGYFQVANATLQAAASIATQISGLNLPNGITPCYAVIQCNGSGGVRWRDDGTAPTASIGMVLPAGSELDYSGELTAIQFITQAGGTPILDITIYAAP